MNISHTYHITTTKETLEPHIYVDYYKDTLIKQLIHSYKFEYNKKSKIILSEKVLDICIDTYVKGVSGLFIFSTPPSTMYMRGEKKVDSMFDLLCYAMKRFKEFTYKQHDKEVQTKKIYKISNKHLKLGRAQHIGGTRINRVRNIQKRYSISFGHKLYILYCIHIKKVKNFSYVIIDDVSSTGATLVACKQTLITHLMYTQKKNPHISYDVQIFSLAH